MTWRVAVLALAIMVSGATAPAVVEAVGGREGYRLMGLLVAGLLLVGVLGAYAGTAGVPRAPVPAGVGSLREQLRLVAALPDFRRLLTTFVVQALAVGAMLAGVAYVARWVLGDPTTATLLFVCFVGPALVLTPAWSALGARVGKRRGYALASLVLTAGALLLLGAAVWPTPAVYAATALVGAGYAGVQVFPLAMLPDVAAVDAARTGETRTGVLTGVWTAGETLGLALGPALFAGLLALGGYVSASDAEPARCLATATGSACTVVQPDSAVTAIVLGFSLVPAVLVLLSLVPLRGYHLDAAAVAAATGREPT